MAIDCNSEFATLYNGTLGFATFMTFLPFLNNYTPLLLPPQLPSPPLLFSMPRAWQMTMLKKDTVMISEIQLILREEFQRLNLAPVEEGYVATLEVKPTLEEQIRLAQGDVHDIGKIKDNMKRGVST